MYNAIAENLQGCKRSGNAAVKALAAELRRVAVAWLKLNQAEMEGFLASDDPYAVGYLRNHTNDRSIRKITYDQYLSMARRPDFYAGDLELTALAETLRRTIVVYEAGKAGKIYTRVTARLPTHGVYKPIDRPTIQAGGPLRLLFSGNGDSGGHYDALCPQGVT